MIKPLTSLRFLFALAVFFCHLSFLEKTSISQIYKDIFSEGFLGVSFFFILSGFILAYSYQNKVIINKTEITKFYIARLARIYPVHFFTLILALILNHSLFLDKFGINMILFHSLIPKESYYFSYNTPSWSLSAEMFFYVFFPFLILLLKKMCLVFYTVFFVGGLIVLYLIFFLDNSSDQHFWIYIFPGVRILDFMLGIILHQLYIKYQDAYKKISSKSLIELSALIFFIIFFTFHHRITYAFRFSIYYWLPMALVILIFALSGSISEEKDRGFLSRIFSNKYLVIAGETSFCFYMLHYLVIVFYDSVTSKFHISVNYYLQILILFLGSLFSSIICYYFIEKPMNKKVKLFFNYSTNK